MLTIKYDDQFSEIKKIISNQIQIFKGKELERLQEQEDYYQIETIALEAKIHDAYEYFFLTKNMRKENHFLKYSQRHAREFIQNESRKELTELKWDLTPIKETIKVLKESQMVNNDEEEMKNIDCLPFDVQICFLKELYSKIEDDEFPKYLFFQFDGQEIPFLPYYDLEYFNCREDKILLTYFYSNDWYNYIKYYHNLIEQFKREENEFTKDEYHFYQGRDRNNSAI